MSGSRLVTLDVLRGFALFGIFYAHMLVWFAGGPLEQHYYQTNYGVGSGIAMAIYMLFVIAKFFSLFAFLFGVSFHIQLQSLAQRHTSPASRFAWRLFLLAMIGLVHHIFWRADILSIYAVLGFVLIFSRHLCDRRLLVLGMMLVLNLPTKVAELITYLISGHVTLFPVDLEADGAAYTQLMREGSWTELFAHNFAALWDKTVHQVNSGRGLITLGYFLLGVYAGRRGWFSTGEAGAGHFRWLRRRSLIWIAIAALALVALAVSQQMLGSEITDSSLAYWAMGLYSDIYNTAMTFLYIALVSLLMLRPNWQRRLAPLARVGKLALSVYLLQSLVGVLLFFHVGLGLFDQTTPGVNSLLAIGIFAVMMIVCGWWLKYFQYGPVEWLWRSATERRWIPIRGVTGP
jgi:uncharacterized protein